MLKAGESKQVSFTLNKDDLAFVNAQLKTVTEAGEFEVMIGDKKATFSYK
jgi:beta-glucosidase